MKTLWVFGDSFTFGHGCRPDGPTNEYYYNYKMESDDIWPNLLGKILNLKVKNLGHYGVSNDYILDSIIDNFNMIESNDVVIIEKTFYQRFDVPRSTGDKFQTIYAEGLYQLSIDLEMKRYFCEDKLEIETVLNYGVLFFLI
jgi:hypothetical protein